MNYGIITYSNRPMRNRNNITRLNIGDPIQTMAMQYIYKELGINSYIEISRYQAKNYSGNNVLLPFQCFNRIYNQLGQPYCTLPVSKQVTPLFFSFHLHSRCLSQPITEQLKQFEPIGCRDEETKRNMEQHGINAYLSGCVTALFPKRKKVPDKDKVFFIDIPKSLKQHIPENLMQNSEFLGHHIIFERQSDEPIMTREEYISFYSIAQNRLEQYAKEATLVVTSRLHAAVPCMAMGIPVILVSENFDGRFSWLDKFLTLYTPDKFNQINWNPSPINYETQKINSFRLLADLILQKPITKSRIISIDQFYSNRTISGYNKAIIKQLKDLPFWNKPHIKFGVWGLTTLSETLKNIILDQKKDWSFVAAIDKSSDGFFEGIPVKKPDEISLMDKDIILFIIPENAQQEAQTLLKKMGRSAVYMNKYIMNYSF